MVHFCSRALPSWPHGSRRGLEGVQQLLGHNTSLVDVFQSTGKQHHQFSFMDKALTISYSSRESITTKVRDPFASLGCDFENTAKGVWHEYNNNTLLKRLTWLNNHNSSTVCGNPLRRRSFAAETKKLLGCFIVNFGARYLSSPKQWMVCLR